VWGALRIHTCLHLPALLRLQVDVWRCVRVDQRQFQDDFFDLSGNACASLHDNTLALTSVSVTVTMTVRYLCDSSDLDDIQCLMH
jgi:hypothetical protein